MVREPEQILLVLEHERARARVRESLREQYRVVVGTPEELDDGGFDLLMVDGAALGAIRRAQERPGEVPAALLVVAGPHPASPAELPPQVVHDVIRRPIRTGELRNRVANLLRLRRLSARTESDGLRLLDSSPVPAVIVQDEQVAYANPAMLEVGGWTVEQAVGKPYLDFFRPEDHSEFRRRYAHVMSGGEPGAEFVAGLLTDAGVHWMELRGAPVTCRGRRGVLAVALDVTQLRKAQQELRDSESRYRTVFENTGTATVIVDTDTTITLANGEFARLVGYPVEEIEGKKSWTEFVAAQDQERMKGYHEDRRKRLDGVPRRYEFRLVDRTGTVRDMLATVAVLPDTRRSVASLLDITERKEMEARLRESEQWFRSIFDGSRDAVFIADEEARFVAVNDAATELTGYCREELLRMRIPDLHEEEDLGAYRKFFDRIMGGQDVTSEAKILRRDGTKVDTEFSNRRIVVGDMAYMHTVARDVAARKRVDRELRDANRQLADALQALQDAQRQIIEQERQRVLTQMASGIAHDFNNVLSTILGYSDLLLANPAMLADTETVRRDLELIRSAASDAAQIVRRMRRFYRPANETEMHTILRPNTLVQDALSMTKPRWKDQAQAGGVSIEVRTDLGRVPDVAGNETELREILTNLIFNSADAIRQKGTILLRTRREGEHAVFEVQDTGAGMDPETLARCRDAFFTTKAQSGRGLGLAVVRAIVARHGGNIDIESAPGRGTTVRVRLPAATDPQEPPTQVEQQARPGLRVLVVENEESQRRLLRRYLEIDGHSALTASDGEAALAKLAQEPCDLVITDRAMPAMGGDRLAAAIKETHPATPVIMLTGFGSMMEAAGEKPESVDLLLSKPITLDELRAALADAQAESRRRGSSGAIASEGTPE